ncbi:hypothetical protein HELRODRAFT_173705 [Helobdella robusta]|uniref:carbonic anhydrase n=1 Tax=Helobdella robusta TaxID=6412 RepID=T1F751_HELRO|nr:hypothetical protein HELRODRAFT_173705 [Helobdella robusta]ESO03408.1 hypothetical protein HELRODRAFT_173705 [Helobdella robusta]
MKNFFIFLVVISVVGDVENALLRADDTICKTGHKQSPIDITNVVEAPASEVTPWDIPNPEKTYHTLHYIAYDRVKFASMDFNFQRDDAIAQHFENAQFKWPSEHTINGTQYPLEIVMVFQNFGGPEMKTVIFAEIGKPNCELQKYVDELSDIVSYTKCVTHIRLFKQIVAKNF